ncbi:MAG: FG-GAP-like repeat-containing protein [Agarilytica sp.]
MFGHCLRLVIGVLGFSACVNAADFGSGKYDVYMGDINGDGEPDIYLGGKDQFVLLHGDIVTPIKIPPKLSYEILADNEESSMDVDGHTFVTVSRDWGAPNVRAPHLSDDEISVLGLTRLVEYVDYFFGDFNGDNVIDILLAIEGAGITTGSSVPTQEPVIGRFIFFDGSGEDAGAPSVTQSDITGYFSNEINFFETSFQVTDVDGDGRDDLMIENGELFADQFFSFSISTGSSINYDYSYESEEAVDEYPATIVGSSAGVFRVDEVGAATYAFELDLPQGVSGVTPTVRLSYSSQAGNSVAGQGWSLGAGAAITRCHANKFIDGETNPIQFNAEDKFCFNGQRLILVSGIYGDAGSQYKTEIDAYNYVYAVGGVAGSGNPDFFEVVSKDGTLQKFGGTVESKTVINSKTLSWALSSSQDNLNNVIQYNYLGDLEDHRLNSITYADGLAEINFYYEDRPDPKVAYMAGERILMSKRLDRIDVVDSGNTLRSYELTYLKATNENRMSRLYHIQECASVGADCLPPLKFGWETQAVKHSNSAMEFSPAQDDDQFLITFKPADINGDGCQDLVFGWVDGSYFRTSYSVSTDNCTAFEPVQNFVTHSIYEHLSDYFLEVIDYNADGYSDIALRYAEDQNWAVYLSSPDSDDKWRLGSSVGSTGAAGGYFVDVDADGLVDILGDNEIHYLRKLSEVHPTSGTYYAYSEQESITPTAGAYKGFGEFNGDGSIDHIKYHRATETENFHDVGDIVVSVRDIFTFWTSSSEGNEVYASIEFFADEDTCQPTATGCETVQYYLQNMRIGEPLLVDVNSDGLTDFVLEMGGKFELYLNNGNGFVKSQTLPVESSELKVPEENFNLQPSFVDYNRDGFPDVYWQDRQTGELKISLWRVTQEKFGSVEVVESNLSAENNLALLDINGDGAFDKIEMVNAYSDDHTAEKQVRIYPSTNAGAHNTISQFDNGFGSVTIVQYERMNLSSHYARTRIDGPDQKIASNVYPNLPQCFNALPVEYPACVNMDISLLQFEILVVNPLDLDIDSDEYFRPVFTVNSGMPIVTSVESTAPIPGDPGATSAIDYVYTDARIQAGGRGFLGFETLTTVDLQTGVSTTTKYHQDFPLIGRPEQTWVLTAEGEILRESENTYTKTYFNAHSGNAGYYQVQTLTAKETEYSANTEVEGGEDHIDDLIVSTSPQSITTLSTHYDIHGNLISSETKVEVPDVNETNGYSVLQIQRSASEYCSYVLESSSCTNEGSVTLHQRDYSYAQLGRVGRAVSDDERLGVAKLPRTVAFTYLPNGMLSEEIIEPGLATSTNLDDLALYTLKKSEYDLHGNLQATLVTGWNGGFDESSSPIIETRSGFAKFDSSGRYPEETYDRYGRLIEKITDRNKYGAPTRIEKANGVVATYTHDVFGRERTITDNTATANTVTTEYLRCSEVSPGCPSGAQYAVRTSAQSAGTSIKYFDRIGRTMRTATNNFNNEWVYVDTEYDNLGRVDRVSEPHLGTATLWLSTEYDLLGRTLSTTVPAAEEGQYTVTSLVYDGLATTTTISENLGGENTILRSKKATHNKFGELIKVEENTHDVTGDYALLEYFYNTEGKLERTLITPTEGGQIETILGYDRLGRKVTMSDPDKGQWEYSYNAFGELIRQSDGKDQVVRNVYDRMGRLSSRTDFLDSAETQIEQYTRWYYDGETDDSSTVIGNAVGQTTAIIMSRGEVRDTCVHESVQHCQYPEFDEFGRPIGSTLLVNGDNIDSTPLEQFNTSQTYDSATGRIDTSYDVMHDLVKDEDGAPISSGTKAHYDSRGFLTHTTDVRTGDELYRTLRTNIRGQVTHAEVAGFGRQLDYNLRTGNLERQIAYIVGLGVPGETPDASTIQFVTYEWDIVGNLQSRHNQNAVRVNNVNTQIRDLQESFCYDNLNRLIKTNIGTTSSATCGAVTLEQQDQRYDSIGNITYKSGLGAYTYTQSDKPHAVRSTSEDSNSFNYDDNGNLLSDDTRTLTYSSFDKPVTISKGTELSSSFVYGPDRGRYLHIKENDTAPEKNTTTLYLGNVERILHEDGNYEWRRTAAGSLHTFETLDSFNMIGDEQKRVIFKDHLGSIDVIVNAIGNIEQSMSFNPWGERRHQEPSLAPLTIVELLGFSTDITRRGYTGHEMLDELGLIHMNGRIFDAKLARFLQADPFIQAATDGQMYNRYSYLRNNPLNATDPSGYLLLGVATAYSSGAVSFIKSRYKKWKHHASEFGLTGGLYYATSYDRVGAQILDKTNGAVARNDVAAQWAPTVVSMVTSMFCGPCSIGFSAMATADINYYRTSDFNGAIHAGGRAAAYAAITYGIGQYLKVSASGDFVGNLSKAGYAMKIAMHGTVGGIMSKLNGGSFGNGFVSAGFSAAASPFISEAAAGAEGGYPAQIAVGVVATAMVGGTASALSGGKFANGARMAVIIYVLNEMQAGANGRRAQKGNGSSLGNYGPLRTPICNTAMEGCTPQSVYNNGLKILPGPGGDGTPIENGAVSELFVGPTQHFFNDDTLTVQNVALEGHVLSGVVTRQVTTDNNGWVYIETSKVGPATPLNVAARLVDGALWRDVDLRIRRMVHHHATQQK